MKLGYPNLMQRYKVLRGTYEGSVAVVIAPYETTDPLGIHERIVHLEIETSGGERLRHIALPRGDIEPYADPDVVEEAAAVGRRSLERE